MPSPKFHSQFVIVPFSTVVESMKFTINGWQPDATSGPQAKSGIGCVITISVVVSVQPKLDVTINSTLKLSVRIAKLCNGFCWIDVVPSLKFQAQFVIIPLLMVDKSVKGIVSCGQAKGAVKSATGAG